MRNFIHNFTLIDIVFCVVAFILLAILILSSCSPVPVDSRGNSVDIKDIGNYIGTISYNDFYVISSPEYYCIYVSDVDLECTFYE